MNKRIMSVVMSALLVVVAILFLQNEKVVESADDLVLLEKRHPGYWKYLHSNAVYTSILDNKIVIFPNSKMFLGNISYTDFLIFERNIDNNKGSTKKLLYFFDGTGIDLDTLDYGEIDSKKWEITNVEGKLEKRGQSFALSTSIENPLYGIGGISPSDASLTEITDLYQYLYALSKGKYSYVISVMDDARGALDDFGFELLYDMGLSKKFNVRDSYIAVVEEGKPIYEKVDTKTIDFEGTIEGYPLYVLSSGFNADNDSSILVNYGEFSKKLRGINIAVVGENGVIDSVSFDSSSKLMTCTR